MITQDRLKEVLDYDPNTGAWVWKVTLANRAKAGSIAGYINNVGYRMIRIDGQMYQSSRLAFLYQTGFIPNSEIDHIDRNPSNDSWTNLREADRFQQCQNQKMKITNTSGYKGVRWDKGRNRWAAQIDANGKRYSLGRFVTLSEAINARKEAEEKLHKEFRI